MPTTSRVAASSTHITKQYGTSVVGEAVVYGQTAIAELLINAKADMTVVCLSLCLSLSLSLSLSVSLSLSLSCGLVLYGPIHSLDLLSWIEKQKRPVAAWVRDH